MAGKMSAAMRGLSNFLRQEARMTNNEATQTLASLRSVSGWNDDDVAKAFTAHLRGKFKAAAAGETYNDLPEFENFLRANNNTLGGDIWTRGQRAGEFSREWDKRNFAQYKDLDTYTTHYNNALTNAVRGKTTVDYDKIGKRIQNDAIKTQNELDRHISRNLLDEQAAREERIAEGLEAPTPEAARAEAARAGAEATGDIKAQNASVADRQMKAYEAGQRERERQQFARDMGIEDPDSLSLESMDRVKANIRENLDKESQGGSVNQIFLNQLDKDGAIRARQAAIDNVNKRIADEQKAFRDYDNVLHEKIQEDGAIEDLYDTYDQKAKLTDDQIKESVNQELIKAQRAFAQNPTADNAVKDYVASMRQLGQDADTAQAFGNAYAARARMLQAEAEKKGLENVGSGKTLQETAAGSAQEAAVADAAADFTGVLPTYEQAMAGNGKIALDRAMLRERMGGDPTDWGYDAAAEHLAKEQEKFLNKRVEAINKSKASAAEKNKMYNDAVATVQKNISEGPGMSNYFFGNQLHTGAIGAAAIMGTMGVAFGGRKSNAELYSSPF